MVFHTSTWKIQYEETFELPPLHVETLGASNLQNWRHPPRSAGRPPAHGRVEAVNLNLKKHHRCGFCGTKGHHRSTCENKDLDKVYMEATKDTRFFKPLPVLHEEVNFALFLFCNPISAFNFTV